MKDKKIKLGKPQKPRLQQTDVSGAVALLEFLKEEQQEDYKKATGEFDASIHQYYEEGIIAVLQLIKLRFGN
jgi:hypothetical protein